MSAWKECFGLIKQNAGDKSFHNIFTELNEEAKTDFVSAVEIKCKNLNKNKKIVEAVSILEQALKITKIARLEELACSYYIALGAAELNKKKFPTARIYYGKALALRPQECYSQKRYGLRIQQRSCHII